MRFDGSDRRDSGGMLGRALAWTGALMVMFCFAIAPPGAHAVAVETPLGGVEVGLDEDGVDVGVSVPAAGTDVEAKVGAGEEGISIDAQVNTPAANVNVGGDSDAQSGSGSNTSDERSSGDKGTAGSASNGATDRERTGTATAGESPDGNDSQELGSARSTLRSNAQGADRSQDSGSAPVTGLIALVAAREPISGGAASPSSEDGASVVAQLVAYIPTWLWVALGLLLVALLATAAFGVREHRKRRNSDRAATLDPLTQIANVKAFEDRLAHEWSRSNRYGGALGVLMLDLDRFKEVNDDHGHSAGDEVLIAVARELRNHTRDTDLVARVGGDEFAVICPQTSLNGLQKLREQLEADLPPAIGFGVGVSIGAAEMKTLDKQSSEMLQRADAAMYARKSSRRGAPARDDMLAKTG